MPVTNAPVAVGPAEQEGRPASPGWSQRLWLVAGVLALAHLVLMFGSFSLQRVAPLDASTSAVTADHVSWPMEKGFAGGYLTCLSFLVFLLLATLLARLLRGDSPLSEWASSTVAAAGSVYVAILLGGVLPSLGTALYDGHHGAPLATVAAFDHTHWFATFLSSAALGVFTVAVAAGVQLTGALPSWVAFTGYAVGSACIVAVPAAGVGLVDIATVVWSLWCVGLAVTALRTARKHDGPGLATAGNHP